MSKEIERELTKINRHLKTANILKTVELRLILEINQQKLPEGIFILAKKEISELLKNIAEN